MRKGAHFGSERGGLVLSRTMQLVREARDLPPSKGEVSIQPGGTWKSGRFTVLLLARAALAALSTFLLRWLPACAFTHVMDREP